MVDRYTKVVLTVIAISLVVIAVEGARPTRPAQAQNWATHVIVDSVTPGALRNAGPMQVWAQQQ